MEVTPSCLEKKIDEEYYELFWTNPGSNTPQNNNRTATYIPSQKPSKEDE